MHYTKTAFLFSALLTLLMVVSLGTSKTLAISPPLEIVANESSEKVDKSKQPNIVLIYIDDLGWRDVGFNGSKYYETPNIDRISNEGINFTDAYANAPNCAPSRACLMSGQYSPRHGIYTVGNPDRGKPKTRKLISTPNKQILPSSVQTMAETIQSAGYKTAFMGKWHLGEGESTGPSGQGFDLNVGGLKWGHPKGYFSPYKNPYLKDGPKGEYLTDRLNQEAVDFIDQNKSNPFFLCLAHYAVHTPIQAKKEIAQRYKMKEPVDGQKNANYAAMIESVDTGVGMIFKKLTEHGLDENTLVIYYSDNGGYGGATDNSPLRGCKGMLYEGGIRVPLAMRWPKKIKPGQKSSVPVIGTDLYPTLAEIADAKLPEKQILDGASLVALMSGEKKTLDRDAIFWHFPAYLQGKFKGARKGEKVFRTRPGSAIRVGDWKLIEYFEDGGLELYNVAKDLSEENDLANSNEEKRNELHKLLKQWRSDLKAPVPTELNPKYVAGN